MLSKARLAICTLIAENRCSKLALSNRNHLYSQKINMCILFTFLGSNVKESDYSLILISNRDEFYDRPAQHLGPWSEDPNIYGGRDLEPGCEKGSWLSISPLRQKIGVLLNLPRTEKVLSKSRGKLVADYVRCETTLTSYIENMRSYIHECNGFVLVTLDFGKKHPVLQTYNNKTNEIDTWTDTCLGFSNNLPKSPLKKVEAGKKKLEDICFRYNKIDMKEQLIEELVKLLKLEEPHLPDQELESRRPEIYKELSSIFVKIPKIKYGTRAHTIILVAKGGQIDIIEISLQSPINIEDPKWIKVKYEFNVANLVPSSHM